MRYGLFLLFGLLVIIMENTFLTTPVLLMSMYFLAQRKGNSSFYYLASLILGILADGIMYFPLGLHSLFFLGTLIFIRKTENLFPESFFVKIISYLFLQQLYFYVTEINIQGRTYFWSIIIYLAIFGFIALTNSDRNKKRLVF